MIYRSVKYSFFFFTDTATTKIYTLSLHDALPISQYSIPKEPSVAPGIFMMSGHSASSARSEEHTSELQSRGHLVCRLLLEKKKVTINIVESHTAFNSKLFI